MRRTHDLLFADLCASIAELGRDGGLISPSVYDTAQVLRFHPPDHDINAAVEWLLSRQQADGGWGDPGTPLGRDVPTLATVLLLAEQNGPRDIIEAGIAFIQAQSSLWGDPLPMDIPIAAEVILPRLLDDARKLGLALPESPYAALRATGVKRRKIIAELRPVAGSSALHSWEAWGEDPRREDIDGSGGVGHSPSATAAWLSKARTTPDLAESATLATRYLDMAAAATRTGIPGVVPTVYPIARFEELFLPYGLLVAGLIEAPELQGALAPLLDGIGRALEHGGLGFSDHFDPDGDDTAAGLAISLRTGRPVDWDCLKRFESGDHFCTWRHEMQPSLSTTARAVHALSLGGRDASAHEDFLVRHQLSSGRWNADKWNESWLYITWHATAALAAANSPRHADALRRALGAVMASQSPAGGWSSSREPNATETAYAVLTLFAGLHAGIRMDGLEAALGRAYRWLREAYRPFALHGAACWIGKETYRPYRVDKGFELIALTALAHRFDRQSH